MAIPNDYSRCNGTPCDKRDACERFVCPGTGDRIYMHDAKHGCVGFIDNGKVAQVGGQSFEAVNPRVLVGD